MKYFKSGHHPLPTLPVGIRNTLTIFKTNQSVRVSRYIFFLVKLKGRGRHFLDGAKRGATLWYYTQEHLVFIRDEKVSLFVKFEIILTPLPLFLFNPLTDNHCRTWSSMIILWIDSRTRQKYRILLSTRKRSNNYSWLTPFKRKCFGEYDAVTLTILYLKLFMICFRKFLKLIFQKQPSCPRNICTEHWRKLSKFSLKFS